MNYTINFSETSRVVLTKWPNNQINVKFECRHDAMYQWHNNGGCLLAARDARCLGIALLNETGNTDCLTKKHRQDD